MKTFHIAGGCAEGQFHCRNSNECLSVTKVCDGSFDCLDRSDEAGCGKGHIIIVISLLLYFLS